MWVLFKAMLCLWQSVGLAVLVSPVCLCVCVCVCVCTPLWGTQLSYWPILQRGKQQPHPLAWERASSGCTMMGSSGWRAGILGCLSLVEAAAAF